MPAARPLRDRFLEKVRFGPECWLWAGYVNRYGYIWADGAMKLAHRIAFELFVGPVPEGTCVLHHCDTPACVRWTDHLFVGSQADNVDDCVAKNRHTVSQRPFRGERAGKAILTDEAVRHIRSFCTGRYGQQAAMARLYGVTNATINGIVKGRGWKHLASASISGGRP